MTYSPVTIAITITAAGFAPAQADVSIAVATVRDVTVTMKPAAAPETVNVQENSSSITTEALDTSSAVRGGVVGSHDLETLPLPARSFANIAYLVPGTEPVEPSDPQGPHHRSLHRRKLRPEHELSVDGAENSTTGSVASCKTSPPMTFRNSPCAPPTKTPTRVGPRPDQS